MQIFNILYQMLQIVETSDGLILLRMQVNDAIYTKIYFLDVANFRHLSLNNNTF